MDEQYEKLPDDVQKLLKTICGNIIGKISPRTLIQEMIEDLESLSDDPDFTLETIGQGIQFLESCLDGTDRNLRDLFSALLGK